MTDDPPAEWKGQHIKGADGAAYTNYAGGANLQLTYGVEKLTLHLGLRRSDKRAARASAPTNLLLYYRDYGRVGDVSLGGKSYHAMLLDQFATGDFRPAQGATNAPVILLLDVNNNGKFERTPANRLT